MPISWIERRGNQLLVHEANGQKVLCYYQGNGTWKGNSQTEGANPPSSGGTGGGSNGIGTGIVTAEMVEAAVNSAGGSISAMKFTSAQIAEAFTSAISDLEPGLFGSKARRASLVGQCAQETDWFKTTSEYGGDSTWYAPYYGRGFIQLTHRANYEAFSNYISAKGLRPANHYVDNMDALNNLPDAAWAAIYYFTQPSWNGNNLVAICDSCGGAETGDWAQVSRAINRGSPYSTSAAYGEPVRNTATNAVLAVTPDETMGGGNGGIAERAAAYGMTWIGKLIYSQEQHLRNDTFGTGAGDCSSFFISCYEHEGMDRSLFGGNTGGWIGYTGSLAQTGNHVNTTGNESEMRVGDAVLYTWGGYNPAYDHVAMYVGNNQVLSHGGPGMGPELQNHSQVFSWASHGEVRRYAD